MHTARQSPLENFRPPSVTPLCLNHISSLSGPGDDGHSGRNDTLEAAESTRDKLSTPSLFMIDKCTMYSYDWVLAQFRGYWGRGPKDDCDFCDRKKIWTTIVAEVGTRLKRIVNFMADRMCPYVYSGREARAKKIC
jgi:hypothetical protein